MGRVDTGAVPRPHRRPVRHLVRGRREEPQADGLLQHEGRAQGLGHLHPGKPAQRQLRGRVVQKGGRRARRAQLVRRLCFQGPHGRRAGRPRPRQPAAVPVQAGVQIRAHPWRSGPDRHARRPRPTCGRGAGVQRPPVHVPVGQGRAPRVVRRGAQRGGRARGCQAVHRALRRCGAHIGARGRPAVDVHRGAQPHGPPAHGGHRQRPGPRPPARAFAHHAGGHRHRGQGHARRFAHGGRRGVLHVPPAIRARRGRFDVRRPSGGLHRGRGRKLRRRRGQRGGSRAQRPQEGQGLPRRAARDQPRRERRAAHGRAVQPRLR